MSNTQLLIYFCRFDNAVKKTKPKLVSQKYIDSPPKFPICCRYLFYNILQILYLQWQCESWFDRTSEKTTEWTQWGFYR